MAHPAEERLQHHLPVIGVVGYDSVPETTIGFVLPRAHHLTGKEKYLSAGLAAAQYSGDARPMDMTFTIGVGHDHPRRVLHLDSRNAGIEPPDSITVYGQTDPALTNGSVIDCWRVRRPHCMMSYADLRRHHECVELTSRLSEFVPRLGKLLNLMPVRPKPGRGLQADRIVRFSVCDWTGQGEGNMSKIRIRDLPTESKISNEEMERVQGGASLVEYVVLVDLIPVVEIGVLPALGERARPKLRSARDPIAGAADRGKGEDDGR